MSITLTGRAHTERPQRYLKQLVSHLGRKLEVDLSGHSARVVYQDTVAELEAQSTTLEMTITGPAEQVPVAQDIVGRHLEQFGARDGLTVEWDEGSA